MRGTGPVTLVVSCKTRFLGRDIVSYTNMPILGDLLDSVRMYGRVTTNITKERGKFIVQRQPLDQDRLKEAMKYFELGLVVGFLYLVSFFVAHNESASKFLFILQQIIAIILYSASIVIALRVLKVRTASFRDILTIMGYLWGFMFPFNFLLLTPLLLEIGPSFIYAGFNTEWVQSVSHKTLAIFSLISTLGSLLFLTIWLMLILPWISDTYEITKKRSLAALILGGMPSGLIIGFVLGPITRWLEASLSDWLIAT